MKRFLFCTVLLGVIVPPGLPQFLPLPSVDTNLVSQFPLARDALFGMGIRLQALLGQEDNDQNFLVSPLSATIVIGELLLGAGEGFRQRLVELLSLPNSQLYEKDTFNAYGKDKNTSYLLPYTTLHLQLSSLLNVLAGSASSGQFILSQKSAVFVNDRIKLKREFVENLQRFYAADVFSMDFTRRPLIAQQQINNWAAQNTKGLISQVVSKPPDYSTASIFTNAVYFLADWETPFSDLLNRIEPFSITPQRQVNVTYMIGPLEGVFYAETSEYRVVCLPYKNEELGMYVVLPNKDNPHRYNIKNFVKNLNPNQLLDTVTRGRRHDVIVKFPKMSLTHTFSILEQLKKYRVYRKKQVLQKQPVVTLTSRAGPINAIDILKNRINTFENFTSTDNIPTEDLLLGNAAENRFIRVDDIVQQVVVNVHEKGTEAAAVTASTVDYIGGQKNFVVDRPFVFFIRHEATAATLFWGTIANPVG